MMKENKTELEQNIDKIIENSRKISNIFTLETARLIKAELINNKHHHTFQKLSNYKIFQ